MKTALAILGAFGVVAAVAWIAFNFGDADLTWAVWVLALVGLVWIAAPAFDAWQPRHKHRSGP